uniref:Immunoglobulin V-set domain-containing protein n=1 Tax=Oryzias sinensis TaxID=183150 RepID=A0A8C7WTY7_9TELE
SVFDKQINSLFIRFLLLSDSFALPSPVHPVTVVSTVGSEVVLPCCWKSQLDEAANSIHHIQWVTPPHTVFEQRGEEKWQAAEFGGRLRILEERLGSGDCSLVIKDVQIRDTGKYESFMVVEAVRSKRTRVFLQSVKLSVTDNKSWQSHRPGEDFVIDLWTPYSLTVVFLGKNSSEWSLLWMKEDEQTSERLEKSPRGDKLTLKNLQFSDEGIYKVLDEQGVSVSTIQLSVEGEGPASPPDDEGIDWFGFCYDVETDSCLKEKLSVHLRAGVLYIKMKDIYLY